nr:Glycosyl hydrolase, family 31 [Leptospira interrogans serovar Copenhageni/Icterohaemorrhagiae]
MFFQRVILAFYFFEFFIFVPDLFADYTKIDLPSKKQFSFGKNFQAIQKENVLEIRSVAGTFFRTFYGETFFIRGKGRTGSEI